MEAQESKGRGKLVAGIAVGALVLLFVLQNTSRGKVSFLFWEVRAPAWLWLITIFGLGVVVGLLLPRLRREG